MDSKHFSVWSIFALVFVFKLLFIVQGIDLIDEGFHLTQQVSAFSDRVEGKDVTAAYFLTEYVGGAWLLLWGAPSLLWARLGGVLVYALNAAIIFHILSGYFDKKKTFIAVTVTALFITMHEYNTIIHYFTFPSLLLNVWLLVFSEFMKSGDGDITSKTYGFLLGFLLVPIALSRITLILLLLLPAVMLVYRRITKTGNQQLRTVVPYAFFGLLAATVAFALFYMNIGFLDYYLGNIQTTLTAFITGAKDVSDFGESHNTYRLLDIYIRSGVYGIIGTMLVLMTAFMLFYIIAPTGRKETTYFIGLTTLISAAFIIVSLGETDIRGFYFFAEFIIYVSFVMIMLLSAVFLYTARRRDGLDLLILAGAFIMLITPLGSAMLSKSVHGMWLIMPLMILLAYDARDNAKNIRLKSALSMLDAVLGFIIIISVFFQLINVYMDDENRLNLNTEFKYAPLIGVYSTPQRVTAMDETLFKIDEYTEKGDRILMVTSIPLFYYLTETKPAFGDPWPIFRPLEKIEEDNKDMIAAGEYPKLFVYHKFETWEPAWPKTNMTAYGDPRYMEYFKGEYIENLNYTLLWENEAFAIYKREG